MLTNCYIVQPILNCRLYFNRSPLPNLCKYFILGFYNNIFGATTHIPLPATTSSTLIAFKNWINPIKFTAKFHLQTLSLVGVALLNIEFSSPDSVSDSVKLTTTFLQRGKIWFALLIPLIVIFFRGRIWNVSLNAIHYKTFAPKASTPTPHPCPPRRRYGMAM